MLGNLLCATFQDPATFWQAVEALATTGALIFIFLEIPRLRREAVASRMEGFRYAMDIVGSDPFQKRLDDFRRNMDAGDIGRWPQDMPPIVRALLRDLEIVAALILEKHIDADLFLQVEGLRLGDLGERIRMLEEGKGTPNLQFERELYPKARALLQKAEEWRQQKLGT
jgi:hypothetical protein